jgi:hypothetical protein
MLHFRCLGFNAGSKQMSAIVHFGIMSVWTGTISLGTPVAKADNNSLGVHIRVQRVSLVRMPMAPGHEQTYPLSLSHHSRLGCDISTSSSFRGGKYRFCNTSRR